MTEPSHRRGQVVDDNILNAVIVAIEEAETLSIKVERVAELAGVNKTTIYRRFPKREDLVLAAVLAQADTAIPMPDTGTLRGDLIAVVHAVRDNVTSSLGRALLSASATLTPELAQLRPVFWTQRFAAAAELLNRAVERGDCPPIANPELHVELMVAPIHFRASQTGGKITDSFLEMQVDRLLAAL